MAAGSVKLPDLKQEIRVDTKDLQRAEAAAKRFKREMDRTLRGDHNITLDVKGDFKRLREQLKTFKGEVTADVSGDFTRLRDQLKVFRGDTKAQVSGDLTRLKEQLHEFRGEVDVKADLDVAALKAELATLEKTQDLKFDADITEAERKIGELKALAEAVSDRNYELKFVIREEDARAMARLRQETVAETTAMTQFEGEAARLKESLNGLTRGLETTTRAKVQFGRASAEQREELERAQQAVKAAEAGLKAARIEATQSARTATGSEKELARARKDAAAGSRTVEAADRALADAHGAVEVAAARLQAAEAKTGAVFAQSLPAIAEVEKAERDLQAARAEQERVDGLVGRAESQLAQLRATGTASAKELGQAERYLGFTRESQPAALQRVEAATERLTAAQGKQAAAEARVVSAAAASRKAEEDHERALARVEEATRALTAARASSEGAAARVVELERNVTAAHREAEQSAGRTRAAEQDLARASSELVQVRERVGQALRKSAQDATEAANSHRSFISVLRGTASAAGLATKAIAGLGIAGTVAGGVGILGASAVGLGSALTGAAPAALGLAGALGGVAVTAGGLAAIFKSNEGLKGSSEILKQAFQGIQDDLQSRVNPSIIEFMHSVAGLAPIAREMVPPFAQAFNEIAQMFSSLLKDSSFQDDLRAIVSSGIRQFRSFGEAGRNAIQGIISLAAATGPFVERIAQGFVGLTADFRDWVNEARRTGELNRLLETSVTIIQSLGRTVRDVAVGFKNLFTAADLSGFTAQVLGTLNGIAADFRQFTAERQADLQAMFANLGRQVEGLRPLIGSIADGIRVVLTNIDLTPLMKGIQAIIPQLAAAVTEAGNAIARIAEQAAPAVNSVLGLIRAILPDVERVVATVVRNVTQVVEAVRPGIQRFTQMLANIGDNVLPVIAGAARNLGAMFSAAMIVIKPVGEAIGAVIGLLGDMSGVVGVAISAFLGFKVVQGIFSGATQSLKNLATGTTTAGQKVGILGRAARGLAQPFAAAAVGAGRLAKGTYDVARGADTMAKSNSAILRGLTQVGQAFTSGAQTATNFGAKATGVGTAVTTASASITGTLGNALTGFGRNIEQTGTRLTGLAGNVTTTAQRMTAGLGGAVSQAGSILSGFGQTVATVGTRVSAGLGAAAQTGAGALSRLGSVAGGVAATGVGTLGKAVSGLSGALGGPWGVAITAAITGLTTYAAKSAESAASTDRFTAALQSTGGALNQHSDDLLRNQLASEGVFDATSKLGLAEQDVVDRIRAGGATRQELIDQIINTSGEYGTLTAGVAQAADIFGTSTDSATSAGLAIERLGGEMDKGSQRAQQLGRAAGDAGKGMSEADRQVKVLSDAFRTLRDSTGTADERLKTLQNTLDGFNSTNRTAQDAQKSLNDAIRGSGDSFGDLQGKISIVNGELQTNSEVGSKVYDQTTQIADAALKSAIAVSDDAKAHGDLAGAATKSAAEIQKARDQVIQIATRFGASRQEAERYADQLGLIPGSVNTLLTSNAPDVQKQVELVIQQLQNIPPNTPVKVTVPLAQQTIDTLRGMGVEVKQIPGQKEIEVSAPTDKVKADIGTIVKLIQNPPNMVNGRAEIPTGLNLTPAERDLYQKLFPQITNPGTPPNVPAGVAPGPTFQPGLDKMHQQVTQPQGGAPLIPAGLKADPGFDPALQGLFGQITLPKGGPPALPATTTPGPNFVPQLQNMMQQITNPAGGPPGLPAQLDTDPLKPGIQTAQGMVTNPAGGPPGLPINADFRPLEQGYDQRLAVVQSDTRWVVPVTGNFLALQTEYDRLLGIATTDPRWIVPFSGDFSALSAEYERIKNIITTTRLYIPIYGQFMGIQGLPGGLGGPGGMAKGGLLESQGDRMVDFFANGGMSVADRMALRASGSRGNSSGRDTSLNGMATAKKMGLTPMAAGEAAVVAPNTWRVIGDRSKDDESYIPINNSARSQKILAETAERMGYALQKFAEGGSFSHSSPTNNSTYGNPATETARAVASSVTNNNEAPIVGGDLVITVPQGTDTQEAMAEVNFQLRRAKRGGVYRSGGRR